MKNHFILRGKVCVLESDDGYNFSILDLNGNVKAFADKQTAFDLFNRIEHLGSFSILYF